ncbi:MAG TPA: hypothetical protein VL860_14770 [Planctomycetota bacterium]|nr:hypothetical protein [Planctomycetota bacterium]
MPVLWIDCTRATPARALAGRGSRALLTALLVLAWTLASLASAEEDPNTLPVPIKPANVLRIAVLEFDLNETLTEPALIRGLPNVAAALLRRNLFLVKTISVYPAQATVKPKDPAMAKEWTAAKAVPDADVTVGGALSPDPADPTQYILKLRLYRIGKNPLTLSYTAKLEELPTVIRDATKDFLDDLDIPPPEVLTTQPTLPGSLMMPLAKAFEALSASAQVDPLTGMSALMAAHEEGFKPVLAGDGEKIGFLQLEMARRHPSADAALDRLNAAVKLDPDLSEAYFLLARNLLDAKEASSALEVCTKGLKAHPHFAELMMEMGRAYSQLAEDNPARRDEYLTSAGLITAEALSLRPKSDLAWNDMGANEDDRGPAHRSRAEGCYLKAYALNPLNQNVLKNLTLFYAVQASFDKVRLYGEQLLKLHSTDDDIASEVAKAEFALGDFDAAMKAYRQAVDNGYMSHRLTNYLGLISSDYAAGNAKQAATDLSAFLDRSAEESEDAFELRRLAANQPGIEKRWAKAVADKRVGTLAQELSLLRVLLSNQRYDTARKHIQAAFDIADLPELYDVYVLLLESSGDPADHKQAAGLIERWRTEYPNDPRACFRSALAACRDTRWEAAAAVAAAGLKLLPAQNVPDPEKLYQSTVETTAVLHQAAAQAAINLHPVTAGQTATTEQVQAVKEAVAHLDEALKVLVPDCRMARDLQRMKLALEKTGP